MQNTFKLTFEFNDGTPDNIHYINEALSSMKLNDLRMNKVSASCMYFYDENDKHGINEPECRAVIHKLSLLCANDDTVKGHSYNIEATAIARGKIKNADEFHDIWSKEHPELVMRAMWNSSSDTTDVFIFLYHKKDI